MTKPQESHSGNVAFDSNKHLVIQSHVVKDEDVIDYFRDAKTHEEMHERLDKALKVGVVALRTVGLTENVDYVQKEFNKLDTKINTTFETVAKTVNENLDDHFGEDGKLAEWFEENFGEDGRVVKDLLDPNKEGSPLYNLKSELKTDLQRIAISLGAKEREDQIKQKTTLKGYDFEDHCKKLLSRIAKFYGDGLDDTSKVPGSVRFSKKGDFVITLNSGVSKKIVLELKNEESLTLNKLLASLDEAIKNRDATYAIALVKNVNALPESVGWFNEYNGRLLVCALGNGDDSEELLHEEIVYIAYKWAKAKVMMESMKEKKIDTTLVVNKVEAIRTQLAQFKKIKTECGNIEKSSAAIRNSTNDIQAKINDELTEIMESLSGQTEDQT